MQADMENSVKPSAGQAAKRLFIALRFSAEEQDALAQSRDAVLERLRTGRPSPTANIHLTAGAFERQRGGIVWRGVSRQEGLLVLQRTLVRELTVRGLSVDEKPFVPHVTLVRGARPADDTSDLQLVCEEVSRVLPSLETRHTEVALMWSHHPEGERLTYTPILTAPLRG